jgi:hypothetical protein
MTTHSRRTAGKSVEVCDRIVHSLRHGRSAIRRSRRLRVGRALGVSQGPCAVHLRTHWPSRAAMLVGRAPAVRYRRWLAVGAAVQAGIPRFVERTATRDGQGSGSSAVDGMCCAAWGLRNTLHTNGVRRCLVECRGVETVDAIGGTLYRLDDLALRRAPGLAAWPQRRRGAYRRRLDGFFAEAFGASSDRDARRRYLSEIIGDGGDFVLWSVTVRRSAWLGCTPCGGHVSHRAGLHAARGTGARIRSGDRGSGATHTARGPRRGLFADVASRVRTGSAGGWAVGRRERRVRLHSVTTKDPDLQPRWPEQEPRPAARMGSAQRGHAGECERAVAQELRQECER